MVGYGQATWRFLSTQRCDRCAGIALHNDHRDFCNRLVRSGSDSTGLESAAARGDDRLYFLDIPSEQPTPDEGTAGLNKGDGGGSKPKKEKPGGGGGGGGCGDTKPASFGKTPQASLTVPQVVAPDPKPPDNQEPIVTSGRYCGSRSVVGST